MKLVGNLICQNAMPDIIRCVESVAPVVDDFYIMDGGSTDGTWELLKRYEKLYNLTLFQHPYDEMSTQRNRLIDKTPEKSWILNIDQDEKISWLMRQGIREFTNKVDLLVNSNDTTIVSIPFFEFVQDMNHCLESARPTHTKMFYHNGKTKYIGNYHCVLESTPKNRKSTIFLAPDEWTILHYAFMDERRLKVINDEIDNGKRPYDKDHWDVEKREKMKIPLWRI